MSKMVPMYGFGGGSGGTGATLTVTAPAGCTVTVSKDGKTKTKVADASGIAVFKGLATGEWTVTITDGVRTSVPKSVTITADYSTAISFFAATINVSYPAGSICTATDGVTTLSAPDTSGTWECVVPNAGTWAVSLDSGFSETVSITRDGQLETIDKWYLYNAGDERNYITGGWTANNVSISSGASVNALTITKNESDMVLKQTTSQRGACISTSKAVDITDYKTIFFDIAYNRGSITAPWGIVAAHPNRSTVRGTVEKFVESNTDGKIVPLDISALSGTNYITIGLYHQCTMTVRKVWLA